MFTIGAIVLVTALVWYANRANNSDRSAYDEAPGDTSNWLLLLHIRQDIKLVAFLLAGVVILLGVIADRV